MRPAASVTRPTLGLVGEAGPESGLAANSGAGGDLLGGTATKENTRETGDNTKQLKMLNDQLFVMLHPSGGGGGGGGGGPVVAWRWWPRRRGGLGGGAGGGGGGGGWWWRRSTWQRCGPGTGAGLRLSPDYGGKLAPKLGGKGDPRGLEGYIRQTAAKYEVDPDVAMRAQSEGLGTFYGDRGKSGGAFHSTQAADLETNFRKKPNSTPSIRKMKRRPSTIPLNTLREAGDRGTVRRV